MKRGGLGGLGFQTWVGILGCYNDEAQEGSVICSRGKASTSQIQHQYTLL
jgi:hypothetical protein